MKSEEGSILPICAFLLIALLMSAGLIVDGSRALFTRLQMQTAADASALAGTHMFSLGYSDAEINAEVMQLALLNHAEVVSWSYTVDGRGISVTTEITIETYFARIMPGYATLTVGARGAAGAFPITTADNLMPYTMRCSDVAATAPGTIVRFWDDDQIVSGNVGWLDWNGGSSSAMEIADDIREPARSHTRAIGEWIDTSPGVKSASLVHSALNTRLGQSVSIPLYNNARYTGNNAEYQLCGFARFILTDYNFQGNDKYIEGRFLRYTLRGIPASSVDVDFGLYTIILTL